MMISIQLFAFLLVLLTAPSGIKATPSSIVEGAKRDLSEYVLTRKLQFEEEEDSWNYESSLESQLGMHPACHVCSDGPAGYTTTPDAIFWPEFPGQDGDLTCGEVFEFALNGAISEDECDFLYSFNSVFLFNCGCAVAPTVSPAPTTSMNPSEQPSTSAGLEEPFRYMLESQLGMYPVCHLCSGGTGDFTTTPDLLYIPGCFLFAQQPAGDVTCGEMFEFSLNGAIDTGNCMFYTYIFQDNCGCAGGPTVSPAPTNSMIPSQQPSASPAPSATPCYFCGSADKFVQANATVTIPGLDYENMPCSILHDYALYAMDWPVFQDAPFDTCADVQAYGDECGCAPIVPTISPSPSVSPEPTATPTTTFMPSATPCYICGSADVQLGWNSNIIAVDADFIYGQYDDDYIYDDDYPHDKIEIYCDTLQDYPVPGIFEGDENCAVIQSFARDCDCPNLDPTASPAPTVTVQPSTVPTLTSAPSETLTCSCEDTCNGRNSDCGCWCDLHCEDYQDCCGDVNDFCTF